MRGHIWQVGGQAMQPLAPEAMKRTALAERIASSSTDRETHRGRLSCCERVCVGTGGVLAGFRKTARHRPAVTSLGAGPKRLLDVVPGTNDALRCSLTATSSSVHVEGSGS